MCIRDRANIGNSSGKGNEVSFDGFGVKMGLTYKFSGKHIIDFNSAYLQKAPSIRNTFTNSRVNHMAALKYSQKHLFS